MLATVNESSSDSRTFTRSAALVALLLAGGLAAWTLARLFWSLMDIGVTPPPVVSDTAAASGTTNAAVGVDLSTLHLFGQAGIAPAPIVVDAPDTQLNLTLLGTAAAEDPTSGLAIIADDRNQQGYYRAGDTLPGNAELKEIHVDRVVLQRQGRLETLRLERDDATASPATGRSAGRSSAPAPLALPTARNQRSTAADWQAMRNQARLDPSEMLRLGQQIRAMPVSENGKPVGVRLIAARDAALLQRLGVRSSDVILSVNGIPLNDPGRQFELMKMLNSESRFQVRLKRNGSEMDLSVDASELKR